MPQCRFRVATLRSYRDPSGSSGAVALELSFFRSRLYDLSSPEDLGTAQNKQHPGNSRLQQIKRPRRRWPPSRDRWFESAALHRGVRLFTKLKDCRRARALLRRSLNHMLHRLCRPPSIPLSFNLAAVLPRWCASSGGPSRVRSKSTNPVEFPPGSTSSMTDDSIRPRATPSRTFFLA